MSTTPQATEPVSASTYPRPPIVRALRFVARFLWLVIVLGVIGAVAPNAWSLYQRTQDFNAFLDPNNLGSLFYIPQLTQLVGGDTTVLIVAASGAGVIFLLLVFLGIRAGVDARRERRTLRLSAAKQAASASTATETPAPAVASVAPAAFAPAPTIAPAPPIVAAPIVAAPPPIVGPSYAPAFTTSVTPSYTPASEMSFAPSAAPTFATSMEASPSERARAFVAHDLEAAAEPVAETAHDENERATAETSDATSDAQNGLTFDFAPVSAPATTPEVAEMEPVIAQPESAEPEPVIAQPERAESLFFASDDPVSAAVETPTETTEIPAMSNTPPQNPPNDPYNAPTSAPSSWASAPVAAPSQPAPPPGYAGAPSYPAPSAGYAGAPSYPLPQYGQAPQYPPAPGYAGAPSYPLPQPQYGQMQTYPGSQQYPPAPYGAPTSPPQRPVPATVLDDTVISPAPFAVNAPGWASASALTDKQLGEWFDGWYDTAVGYAEVAPAMIQAFVADLPTHFRPTVVAQSARLGMTGVSSLAKGIDIPSSPMAVFRVLGSIPAAFGAFPKLFLRIFGVTIVGKQRDYLFAVTTPGAKVGVMITGAGRDLYMAWDLYIRRVWNEVVIGLIGLLSLVFGVVPGFVTGFIPGFIIVAFVSFFGMISAGAVLGLVLKRDPTALFRKQGDIFEAHDIQSMTLSVDKALRAAAEKAGVDSKLLREKQDYLSGKGKRVI